MKCAINLLFVLLVFSCSHQGGGNQEETLAPEAPSEALTQEEVSKDTKEEQIPKSAMLHWEEFFRPPPTSESKLILEKKLSPSSSLKAADLAERGRILQALGRFKEAEEVMREVVRINPEDMENLLQLSMLYIRMKNYPMALDLLDQLQAEFKDTQKSDNSIVFRYRYLLAICHFAQGKHNEGNGILRELVALDKSFAPGYVALASNYIEKKKFKSARFIIDRGRERSKEDPALLNLLGVIACEEGQLSEAETWYNKALSLHPHFVTAMLNKSMLQMKKLNYTEALSLVSKAIQEEPQNAKAHTILGLIQQRKRDFNAAKLSFEKAMELDPLEPEPRFNLASIQWLRLGHQEEALRLYYEVLQGNFNNSIDSEHKELTENLITDLRNIRNP